MKGSKLHRLGEFVDSLYVEPLTIAKAAALCLYADGARFMADVILSAFGLSFGFVPAILYLGVILLIARNMGKDELRRIFAWRDVPLPIFSAIMIMFFGLGIVKSELNNLLQMILPVPDNFFDGWFYTPQNAFLVFVSGSLFPGFSEEIFFRGVIARRFYRTYAPRKAIVLSAAIFGIMHLNPWQAVNAFYTGIFLGWIYFRYRSIWLCMFIHAYHNALVDFMALPYVKVGDGGLWRHPIWFDILGLALLGFGLFAVLKLTSQNSKPGMEKSGAAALKPGVPRSRDENERRDSSKI